MGGAGDWEALEDGRRWRMGGAGGWEALEDGRRWRLGGAGDWEALAKREISAGQGGNAVDPERPPKSVVIGTILVPCAAKELRLEGGTHHF